MTARAELRAYVQERSVAFNCEWPGCPNQGTELAHIVSVGMGGGSHADTESNVFWACWQHARISDFEQPAGWAGAAEEIEKLPLPDADAAALPLRLRMRVGLTEHVRRLREARGERTDDTRGVG